VVFGVKEKKYKNETMSGIRFQVSGFRETDDCETVFI